MKKLLSLLLCLALFLPMMTMAGAEVTPKMFTIELDDFKLGLYEGDQYQVAPSKVDGEVYAIIYPAYDATASFHNNFNMVWTKENVTDSISLLGAESYGKMLLNATKSQFENANIKVNDAKLLAAEYEDDIGAFIISYNLDYTGAGVNLVTTVYQLQTYIPLEENSSYIFSFTASTLEDLEAMASYLDNIEDK